MINQEEKTRLRELALRYMDLAQRDENRERVARGRDINDLVPRRPMVWLDEIPWHEMDIDGELVLHCQDEDARAMEWFFLTSLYRWKYIQADMVLPGCYYIQKAYSSSGYDVAVNENTMSLDQRNHIISHHYNDLIQTDAQLDLFHTPKLTAHPELDQRRLDMAREVLDGIMPVKLRGDYIYNAPWDVIPRYRGVEPILIDMIERPDFLHRTIAKFMGFYQSEMEQKEALGLLDFDCASLHCTPPYVSALPAAGYDGEHVRLQDIWFRAMAQMFSSVSPDAHEEFDLQYQLPLAERCGLTYYGCCEPLHDRIHLLKKIPNLRKIGVTPWADLRKSAEQIKGDYVYARKPNPALVSGRTEEAAVKAEIRETIEICLEHGCAYEFVLKDISTVSYRPQNLIDWVRYVNETIDEYY